LGSPPERKNLEGITLENVAKEQRARKATKADDAEVPEYLLIEHLIHDADPLENLDTTALSAVQLEALPKLMNGLRVLGLKWWKKRVTLSFGEWLNKRFAASKNPNSKPTVEWRDGRYVWKEEAGKQSYLKWHSWRESAFFKDLTVTRDAIERTSRASWWFWEDGSTPLF
jgi:hypothetical protein